MNGKQHIVLWLGLGLIVVRLFTTTQWRDLWGTVSNGETLSVSGGNVNVNSSSLGGRVGNAVSGVGKAILGVATGNPGAAVNGVGGFVSGVFNGGINNNPNPSSPVIGPNQSNPGHKAPGRGH